MTLKINTQRRLYVAWLPQALVNLLIAMPAPKKFPAHVGTDATFLLFLAWIPFARGNTHGRTHQGSDAAHGGGGGDGGGGGASGSCRCEISTTETIRGKMQGKFGSVCCRSAVEQGRFGLARCVKPKMQHICDHVGCGKSYSESGSLYHHKRKAHGELKM